MSPTCLSMGDPNTVSQGGLLTEYPKTPAFAPGSNGFCPGSNGVASVRGPRSIRIRKPPQSLHDAQSAVLNQNSHDIPAIPKLAAKNDSSQPHPMRDLLLPQQLLQEQEAKWFQRYRDQANDLEKKFYLQLQESQAERYQCYQDWYECCDKKNKEIQELSAEIVSLTAAVLCGKIEKMKFEENFNLSGALEHMVYQAGLTKMIGTDSSPGIQAGLDELAKAPAFTKVLHDEVAARGLVPEDVTPCIALVYDKAFQRAHGNDSIITLYKGDYTVSECAVLAAFLRMQSEWPHGLEWEERERMRQTKR